MCEWEIDFQSPPLSHAGLFAITGPTGSGKSTILDAITLALFNKVPRFESDTISKNFIERSGSIITRNETDSFVEVEYSCSQGTFRSKWSIAINKRGGLRETDMELIDVSTNKPVLSGKKDVPKKNAELIGLTYDQFIKSILLSQGEFARFLKSKKDERGKLLEDITGMTVYRELGKRAFEKYKEKNEAIKSRVDIIKSEEEQLLSKEKEDELDEFIQVINKEIRNRESFHAAMVKMIEIKNQVQSIENEIQKYKQDEIQVNKTLQLFNEKNFRQIFKHERLLPHLDDVRNYSNNHDSIKNITLEIKQEQPELEIKTRAVTETFNVIKKLTGSTIEKQDAVDALTKFRDRVIYLTTNKINAEKALGDQKIKLATQLKKPTLISYKNENGNVEELKIKVDKELTSVTSKTEELIKQNKIQPVNIIEQKELLNARLKAWEDLKSLVENYALNRDKLKTKEAEINREIEIIDSAKPKLENVFTLKSAIATRINEVRERREKKLREETFDEDRKSLKQGEPCPLCGSLHHPYVHEYFNDISALTKEFQKLEEEEKQYETEIKNLEKQVDIHSGTLEALKKEKSIIKSEIREQETKVTIRKKQLAIDKVGKVSMIEAAISEVEKSVKAINEFEKLIVTKKDLEDFKEAVDTLSRRSVEFEKAKSEVELRYRGTNIRKDCDELSQQFNSYNDAIQKSETKLTSYEKRLEELSKQQTKIEAFLGTVLLSFGYPDILSAFADVLPDAEFSNLKRESADLEGNIKSIKALIKRANETKNELHLNDDASKSKDELLEELNAILQQLEIDKQNITDYQAKKKGNEVRKNRIAKLTQQVDETRQANLKWELLCKYIGDAQGKSFSTFAQGLTLKKLIALANERLRRLNDRYLLDIPFEEEDDDLIIVDTYLGEERRSVRTLSGGETFIVSLALALALSDLASKNVKIESLYIDEGFGSLDPEALDVAISTLEQLQVESNKTIGIISHVDSLKERIETQIQLEKDSSGFSKIIIK